MCRCGTRHVSTGTRLIRGVPVLHSLWKAWQLYIYWFDLALTLFFFSLLGFHSHIQWRSMYSAILSKDLRFGLVDQCLHQHLNFLRYAFFSYLFLGYDLLLPCLKIKIIISRMICPLLELINHLSPSLGCFHPFLVQS